MKLLSIAREAAACRAAWATMPDATAGVHIHHEVLAEELTEPIENRIVYILAHKPKKEQALRLRLMRPITVEALAEYNRVTVEALAATLVGVPTWASYKRVLVPARAEYDRAKAEALAEYKRATVEALAEYNRVTAEAWAEYKRATVEALAEYNRVTAEAWAEYDRVMVPARAEYDRAKAEAHQAFCVPDCPWDGKSIFGDAA